MKSVIIFLFDRASPSGVYYFKNVAGNSSTPYQAFCYMSVIENCGGGGWSLAMKMDGRKVKQTNHMFAGFQTVRDWAKTERQVLHICCFKLFFSAIIIKDNIMYHI
jgi:hypothetical protein